LPSILYANPCTCWTDVYRITKNFEAILVTDELRARAITGEVVESKITFSNLSGEPLHIYWVDTAGMATKLTQTPVATGKSLSINSYVGNEFELRQEEPIGGTTCNEGSCRRVITVVNPGRDAIITINKDFAPMYNGESLAELH
jgi:hypothetical protein